MKTVPIHPSVQESILLSFSSPLLTFGHPIILLSVHPSYRPSNQSSPSPFPTYPPSRSQAPTRYCIFCHSSSEAIVDESEFEYTICRIQKSAAPYFLCICCPFFFFFFFYVFTWNWAGNLYLLACPAFTILSVKKCIHWYHKLICIRFCFQISFRIQGIFCLMSILNVKICKDRKQSICSPLAASGNKSESKHLKR